MVLLAFGPLEFGLPGDTQQNVGSVKSSEVEFGFDLCGGYHRSEILQRIRFWVIRKWSWFRLWLGVEAKNFRKPSFTNRKVSRHEDWEVNTEFMWRKQKMENRQNEDEGLKNSQFYCICLLFHFSDLALWWLSLCDNLVRLWCPDVWLNSSLDMAVEVLLLFFFDVDNI